MLKVIMEIEIAPELKIIAWNTATVEIRYKDGPDQAGIELFGIEEVKKTQSFLEAFIQEYERLQKEKGGE